MNDDDPELADFQTCLLSALHQHDSADAILETLLSDDATLPFRGYVAKFEPEMLELAALLVKKWGRRTSSPVQGLQKMPH
ncbi:MAG: hypothetical protein WCH40_08775 [Verrucomicrobiales bacterium]